MEMLEAKTSLNTNTVYLKTSDHCYFGKHDTRSAYERLTLHKSERSLKASSGL